MKHLMYALLLLTTFAGTAQEKTRIALPGGGAYTALIYMAEEDGDFLINSSTDFMQLDASGVTKGYLPGTASVPMPLYEKRYASTGDIYFLTIRLLRQGSETDSIVFAEFRPGVGHVRQLVLRDDVGFTLPVVPTNDSTYYVFGRQFFWKIKYTESGGFEQEWERPLPAVPVLALRHNNAFVLATATGEVLAISEAGSILWSEAHSMTFHALKRLPDGFVGCGQTPDGHAVALQLDPQGQEVWRTISPDRRYRDIVPVAGGGFAVTGETAAPRALFARISATGQVLGNLTYGTATGTGLRLLQTAAGGFAILARYGSPIVFQLLLTDADGQTADDLSAAQIRGRNLQNEAWQAVVNAHTTLFFDGDDPLLVYPGEKNLAPVFTLSPQIGGYGPGNELHLAIEQYGTNRRDYRVGIAGAPVADFRRSWAVTQAQIAALRRDFGEDRTLDNPVPYDLLTWPAKGNPHLRYNVDFTSVKIAPDSLPAPFVDVNGDGLYNVYDGDYPLIKGNQMAWFALTDSMPHALTHTKPLEIDMFVSVYDNGCPQSGLLQNTVFVDYEIINRSANTYTNTYMGLFTDLDLGCANDDYIGTIPDAHTYYMYNRSEVDGTCFGTIDWAGRVPVFAATFLNQSLDYGASYGPFTTMHDPQQPAEHYYYLSGAWLTRGGHGYNPGSTDAVRYQFPDNPADPQGWSMCTLTGLGNADPRSLGTHGPFSFVAGDTFRLSVALSLHPDVPHPCPDIFSTVKPAVQQIRNWSVDQILVAALPLDPVVSFLPGKSATLDAGIPGASSYAWSTGSSASNIEVSQPGTYSVTVTAATGCALVQEVLVQHAKPAKLPEFQIVPNPAPTHFQVVCPDCPKTIPVRATLFNLHGAAVRMVQDTPEALQVSTNDLAAGVYAVQLWQGDQYLGSKKVVVVRGRR